MLQTKIKGTGQLRSTTELIPPLLLATVVLQMDGSMGVAAISLSTIASTLLQIMSSSFTGPVSSPAAELRGLSLVQTFVQTEEDTTILTDSLASLHALRKR